MWHALMMVRRLVVRWRVVMMRVGTIIVMNRSIRMIYSIHVFFWSMITVIVVWCHVIIIIDVAHDACVSVSFDGEGDDGVKQNEVRI